MGSIKSSLSKLAFKVGYTPKIIKGVNKVKYIPQKYKAVVLISADFELAWAWRYAKSSNNSYQLALKKAAIERENLPAIVQLCEQYNIPITWATVGHLFLKTCNRLNGHAHPEIPNVPNYFGTFWDFQSKDWFEYDPCSDYIKDNLWYCPDLIKLILDSPVQHEMANHTFSHIDCRDGICPPELLKAELKASKQLANELGINLTSFVHPGHTIGNLKTLSEEGFTNFRTDSRNVLGYPILHPEGIWEFEQTAEFNFREDWSIDYHIYRYKKLIDRAINSNTVCVFWFHPSFDARMVNEIWPEVFNYMNQKQDDIWITTHKEYINFIST